MKRLFLSLLIAIALLLLPTQVFAADPTVTITFSFQVVSITNTQSTWTMADVEVDDILYFSADNNQDDDYSQIENTGNVAVDVEIQGTNMEGGDYDLTLAASAGVEQYSLYANSSNGSATYNIEVKSSSYNDITTSLAAGAVDKWSMKLTAPTAKNANEDGENKSATVTLVASESA